MKRYLFLLSTILIFLFSCGKDEVAGGDDLPDPKPGTLTVRLKVGPQSEPALITDLLKEIKSARVILTDMDKNVVVQTETFTGPVEMTFSITCPQGKYKISVIANSDDITSKDITVNESKINDLILSAKEDSGDGIISSIPVILEGNAVATVGNEGGVVSVPLNRAVGGANIYVDNIPAGWTLQKAGISQIQQSVDGTFTPVQNIQQKQLQENASASNAIQLYAFPSLKNAEHQVSLYLKRTSDNAVAKVVFPLKASSESKYLFIEPNTQINILVNITEDMSGYTGTAYSPSFTSKISVGEWGSQPQPAELPDVLFDIKNTVLTGAPFYLSYENLSNAKKIEEGVILLQFKTEQNVNQTIFSAANTKDNDSYFKIYVEGQTIGLKYKTGASSSEVTVSGTLNKPTRFIQTIAIQAEKKFGYKLFVDGNLLVSLPVSAANYAFINSITGLDKMALGAATSTLSPFSGTVKKIILYKGLKTDAELKTITGTIDYGIEKDAANLKIHGKIHRQTSTTYSRFPSELIPYTTNGTLILGGLHKDNCGMYLAFETNSSFIKLDYTMYKASGYGNIPDSGESGIDIYQYDETAGDYVFKANTFPAEKTTSGVFLYNTNNSENSKFIIHFPTYNGFTNLKIVVDDGASFAEIEPYNESTQLPILIYGTSITQGASASKPSLAYTSIVSREAKREVINMGFSGSALMEKEMADFLATIPAEVFFLDPTWNFITGTSIMDKVVARTEYLVNEYRKKNPNTPIILVGKFNSSSVPGNEKEEVIFKSAFDKLVAAGVQNIYFMPRGTTNITQQDGVHPNDAGMRVWANRYLDQLRSLNVIP